MIVAIIAIFAVSLIMYLFVRGKLGHSKLTIALLISYAAFIAQCVDVEYAASVADDKYLDGAKTGWFGPHWIPVLFLNLVVIVTLHVVLYKRGHNSKSLSK